MKVATAFTLDASYGGRCEPAGGKPCNNHYSAKRTIATAWQVYALPWEELVQQGWGVPAVTTTMDPKGVMQVHFFYQAPAGTPDFDLWIDDLSFY